MGYTENPEKKRLFHLALGKEERRVLFELMETYDIKSRAAAIRFCILATLRRLKEDQ